MTLALAAQEELGGAEKLCGFAHALLARSPVGFELVRRTPMCYQCYTNRVTDAGHCRK